MLGFEVFSDDGVVTFVLGMPIGGGGGGGIHEEVEGVDR
jgi:hypothetical protein